MQADKRAQREAALKALRVAAGPGEGQIAQANAPGTIIASSASTPSLLRDPKMSAVMPRGLGGTGTKEDPVRGIATPAQARQLQPGTYFLTPDGRVKVAA